MQLQNHVRGNYYSGLYRNRPVAANIAHLAFEAWHIGLGGGVLIGRLTQFLLAMVSDCAARWDCRRDKCAQ